MPHIFQLLAFYIECKTIDNGVKAPLCERLFKFGGFMSRDATG